VALRFPPQSKMFWLRLRLAAHGRLIFRLKILLANGAVFADFIPN
jgi:hypothetical protein